MFVSCDPWAERWVLESDSLCCRSCLMRQPVTQANCPFMHTSHCRFATPFIQYPWGTVGHSVMERVKTNRSNDR